MAVTRDTGTAPHRDPDEARGMELWLREEVVPVMQAAMADPDRLVPLEEVFAGIEAIHAAQH